MKKLEDIVTNKRERNFSQSFAEFGVTVSRNDVMPGHYYAFQIPVPNFNLGWIPNSEEEWKESPESFITNRQYYDVNPIGLVFAHNKWKHTALILNLKVLPPAHRAAVIMAHINIIEENLDRLGLWDDDSELMSIKDRKGMSLPMFGITPKILEEFTGFKLGYAISGYKLDKVTGAKLLDWDRIGELPHANIDTTGLAMAPGAFGIESVFKHFENKQLT
jgi:hypothetical protein